MVCPFLDRMAVIAVHTGNWMREVEVLPGGGLFVHALLERKKYFSFLKKNALICVKTETSAPPHKLPKSSCARCEADAFAGESASKRLQSAAYLRICEELGTRPFAIAELNRRFRGRKTCHDRTHHSGV
jgi:hypothetical protein